MKSSLQPAGSWLVASLLLLSLSCRPQAVTPPSDRDPALQITLNPARRFQVIDGFGTTGSAQQGHQAWAQELYYGELAASILRVDLTPIFREPYAAYVYNSPWFHNAPGLPGPDGNNVRTYRDPGDYSREWAGRRAPIAVMGPDIERNLAYFDFEEERVQHVGALAKRGLAERARLGDFKLTGSVWSPPPWLKHSSGNAIDGQSGIMPKNGTPFPFIWGGNFSGGSLDTSGTPLALFDDSALGGAGNTSALTQFARGLAAYLLGFQRRFGVPFYAISIQNELGFETFYNSCAYLRPEDYVAALKAVRAELDRHAELRAIRLMGPEDLLGGDTYSLWQFGSAERPLPKNLQFIAAVERDPEAARALDFFSVHGYALDGVHSAGSGPGMWPFWVAGWEQGPAPGLPAQVKGTRGFGKKSWMTETSGEPPRWAPPRPEELSDSALGLAVKLHYALTVGQQSAWIYWQLSDGRPIANETLTDETLRERSPKLVAAKHFFRFIRPGAQRIAADASGPTPVQASAYVHEASGQTTVVLINPSDHPQKLGLRGLTGPLNGWSSTEVALWQALKLGAATPLVLELPALSVITLVVGPAR